MESLRWTDETQGGNEIQVFYEAQFYNMDKWSDEVWLHVEIYTFTVEHNFILTDTFLLQLYNETKVFEETQFHIDETNIQNEI